MGDVRTLARIAAGLLAFGAPWATVAAGEPDAGPSGVFACTASRAGWDAAFRFERDRAATLVAAKGGRRSTCQLRIVALKHAPRARNAQATLEFALRPDSCEGSLALAELDEVAMHLTVKIELRKSSPAKATVQWLRDVQAMQCEIRAWDEDAFEALAKE